MEQAETLKQAQVSHLDMSAREGLISALGEGTGVVRALLETDTTTLAILTSSPPRPWASPPHRTNPSHQDYLGLFSYQQEDTKNQHVISQTYRAKPRNEIINHSANKSYPAAFPKHAAQGSSGTLPAI